jgi:site-specific DNA recombinase
MSTEQQEASIPEQREWARRATPKAGVALVREFEDPGIPGSEIEDRPGLMALVEFVEAEAARKRPIRVIVVWDLDRLSRASSIRTAAVLDRLMSAGVTRIYTPEGWIDLENESDVLLFHVKQDFSRAAFSKSIAKNVTRDALERAAKGWLVAGRPRYGYRPVYVIRRDPSGKERRTPTTLEPDREEPARVETVKWMFHQYATTADSLGDLTRKLNDMGPEVAPPPRPCRCRKDGTIRPAVWKRDTVWDMLTDSIYVGDKSWNVNQQGKYYQSAGGEVRPVGGRSGKKQWRRAPEEDRVIVHGAHPAIIDRETFEAVQKKLAASRWKRTTPQAGGGDWLLSGVVFCGECGKRMVGHTQRHRRKDRVYTYRRYICRTNFREGGGNCRSCAAEQDLIVKEVARIIKDAFTDPKRLQALEDELKELTKRQDKEAVKERKTIERRLAELGRLIPAAARNLLLISDNNRPDAEAALDGLKKERDDLTRRLEKVDAAAEAGQQYSAVVREAIGELQHIEDTIASATPAKVRTLLGRWVEKVTLHFKPPKRRKDGKSRNVLSHIDIDFTPEALHLLPTAANGRC